MENKINMIDKLLILLKSEITMPNLYGLFHIISIILIITCTILLCLFFKNCSEKTFKKIIFIFWIVILIFELYKQFVFSYNINENIITWKYNWYYFPFQFCSTPLYILPLIVFFKDGKIYQSAISFISTFAFFAGLCVIIYPGNVFLRIIGINLQTMIHHGSQIVLGIFCLVHNRNKVNIKFFLKGLIVFIILLLIALIFNIYFHNRFE